MIEVNVGCCWTLAFKNSTLGDDLFVWVCRNAEVYKTRLKQLESAPNITIVQAGAAIVKES